jgi:hypothetical protein
LVDLIKQEVELSVIIEAGQVAIGSQFVGTASLFIRIGSANDDHWNTFQLGIALDVT